jgi:single-strand DNA-binding protein
MASFNRVILMGNLTRDPELRVTQSGVSVCKFAIATSRQIKSPDGATKEETTFIDIDAFGKQAEIIGKYFSKGRPILVEGRLRLDQWETQSGEKRSKLGVVLETFQFVGPRGEDDGGAPFTGSIGGMPQREVPVEMVEDLSQNRSNKDKKRPNFDVQVDEDIPF